MLAKEVAKPPNMLRKPAVGHVAAVPRENFGLRAVGYDPVFVGVAKDELARLQRIAGAGRGLLARSFNDRLRETVPVAEMIVSIAKRRNRLEVERGEDFDACAPRYKLCVLRDAPVMFRIVSCEEDDDRVQFRAC